ncbi:hypothetical protein FJZ26_05100 [Candidatus Parvarchaeota archaeon]|nr:hypothetical protein [Candidatus Parvarchaeota archaeon]
MPKTPKNQTATKATNQTSRESKNPWLAAALNFILYGLGYIYAGKRVYFGIGLVITDMIWIGLIFLEYAAGVNQALLSLSVGSILLGIMFAYDGYNTVQESNSPS